MSAIADRIRAEYAADAAALRRARIATDVPFSYETIDPEWFTAVLCRNVPGAAVLDFECGIPDDGSSNRRQVMLRYNAAGEAAGLPARVFCKSAMRVENRVMLGLGGASLCETEFYKLVRPRLSIDAPVALHARFDPRSYAYIIVMEDLTGDVEFCTEERVMNRAQAESMVSLLADYHATFHEHPDLGTPALPFPRWADWWKVTEETGFEASCLAGIEAAEAVIPPRLFARRHDYWGQTVASAERHRALPQTLTHMDGHFSNWYLRPDDSMGLCDWQFVTVGSGLRDFVYGITTGLAVEDRRAWERDLLHLYLDGLASRGVPKADLDATFDESRRQLLSALAFWLYPLRPPSGMPDMQSQERILKYIGRIAQAIDDLDALDGF